MKNNKKKFPQEQLLKLKLQSSNVGSSSGSSSGHGASHHQSVLQNPYAPQQMASQQLTPMYIAAAIAIAILGLLLGKFALWTVDVIKNNNVEGVDAASLESNNLTYDDN